jgi:hypothetical protein
LFSLNVKSLKQIHSLQNELAQLNPRDRNNAINEAAAQPGSNDLEGGSK